MNVLGLDSATDACSAAILRGGTVIARRHETMRRGHAEVLMVLVQDVMRRAALDFGSLDLIATTVGPGGFTGLRIGLASARGLALAGRIPIVGITTLEAVARAQLPVETPFLIALDTKRADVYVQLFASGGVPQGEPAAVMPNDIAARLPAGRISVGGNARDAVLRALAGRNPRPEPLDGPIQPDAAIVAAMGAERHASCGANISAAPRPLYLRPPDARLPSASGT